jgi:hypothetical protein
MRNVILGMALLLVVAACGGGSDDGGDTTTTAGSDSGQATTTTTLTTTTGASDGGDNGSSGGPGANTEFCDFDQEFSSAFETAFNLSQQGLEDSMQAVLQLAEQAADDAPSAIEDDLDILLKAFSDFVDVLADIDYDIINNLDAFESDPRVMYFDSAEFLAAGEAVDDYCGNDADDASGPPSSAGTLPPGFVVGDLPEDFPAGLVPPDVTDVQSLSVPGAGFQVTFTSDVPFDDILSQYTNELGEPQALVSDGPMKVAQWFLSNGSTVLMSETAGTVVIVVVGTDF